jgi:hypothetical protein
LGERAVPRAFKPLDEYVPWQAYGLKWSRGFAPDPLDRHAEQRSPFFHIKCRGEPSDRPQRPLFKVRANPPLYKCEHCGEQWRGDLDKVHGSLEALAVEVDIKEAAGEKFPERTFYFLHQMYWLGLGLKLL